MDPLTLVATMGLLGSVTTAVLSIWRGIVKFQAEAMLVKRLRSDREVLQRFVELRRKLKRQEQDVSAVYADYVHTLENAIATLPEADRKRIREGLTQPSEAGRSSYVQKLVEESTAAAAQSA